MTGTFTTAQIAILILIALVGREIITLTTTYFFKKVARDDYVTKKDCEGCLLRTKDFITRQDCELCAKQDDSTLAKLTSEMSAVKGLLLVMATKQGIPPEELKDLVN